MHLGGKKYQNLHLIGLNFPPINILSHPLLFIFKNIYWTIHTNLSMIFTIQELISNNLKYMVFILTFSCIIINFEGICDLTSRLTSEKIFSDFFKPSEKILPKQYVLQRQNSNLRVARANKFSNTNCQTHTVQLLGKCIVMCDQSMLGFCH